MATIRGADDMLRPSRRTLCLPYGEPAGIRDRATEVTDVRPAALLGANRSGQLGK